MVCECVSVCLLWVCFGLACGVVYLWLLMLGLLRCLAWGYDDDYG